MANGIKKLEVSNVPDQGIKIDREFMDDVIAEAEQDYKVGVAYAQKERKIAMQFIDDVIAEAEQDYKVGVRHKAGLSYSQMKK